MIHIKLFMSVTCVSVDGSRYHSVTLSLALLISIRQKVSDLVIFGPCVVGIIVFLSIISNNCVLCIYTV